MPGAGAGAGAGEHKSLNDMRQNVQVTIQPAARLIRARPVSTQGREPTKRGSKIATIATFATIDNQRSMADG